MKLLLDNYCHYWSFLKVAGNICFLFFCYLLSVSHELHKFLRKKTIHFNRDKFVNGAKQIVAFISKMVLKMISASPKKILTEWHYRKGREVEEEGRRSRPSSSTSHTIKCHSGRIFLKVCRMQQFDFRQQKQFSMPINSFRGIADSNIFYLSFFF